MCSTTLPFCNGLLRGRRLQLVGGRDEILVEEVPVRQGAHVQPGFLGGTVDVFERGALDHVRERDRFVLVPDQTLRITSN